MPAQTLHTQLNLTASDLEAALQLLTAEEQAVHVERRTFLLDMVAQIALALSIAALFLGLLTIWVDGRWGWGLLGTALATFIIFGVFTKDSEAALERLRATIRSSEIGQAAEEGWAKRSNNLDIAVGCVVIVGGIATLAGVSWLIYGMVVDGQVNPAAIALASMPLVILIVLIAIQNRRELIYYNQLMQLQARLKQASGADSGEVALSSAETDLLARVETQQVARGMQKAVQELPKLHEEYAVSVRPTALRTLRDLAGQDRAWGDELRDLIDSLQTAPRPPAATPAPDVANRFVLTHRGAAITYAVDDTKQRVDVLSIEHEGPGDDS